MLPCFNSPSKVPYSDVNLLTGRAHAPRWGPDSSTSEVTTIQLEFRDLSRITGEKKYEVRIQGASVKNKEEKVIRVMVFNTTFINISVIPWRSVLLVEET